MNSSHDRFRVHRVVRRLAALLLLSILLPGAGEAQESRDTVVRIAPLEVEVLRSRMDGARTPYAVAGLSAEQLTAIRPGAFLSDALVALPGLQVQNRHNFAVGERIAVRGFGARSQFGVRGLRVLLDGIPATLPDGQTTLDHVDPGALGRVELMRGPASALYGNGAGGVLLLQSAEPGRGERLVLSGAGGSHGLLESSATAERSDAATSSRIRLTRLSYDGFRANPIDGGTYGAADRWTLTASHRLAFGGGGLRVVASGLDLDAENPGSLPADSLGDPDRSAWGFNVRQGAGKEIRQLQLGATWERRSVSATVWGLTRDLSNPIPNTIIDLERTGLGGRVAVHGFASAVRWDMGVDLEAQRDDRENHDNDGGDRGALTLDQREGVTGLGVFGALSYDRGSANVHAALRYDRVDFSVTDRFLSDGVDESGGRTMDALSPSIGAQVRAGEVHVFGSFATFLQTPTTTELANRETGAGGFNPELSPTRGRAFEAGLRGVASGRVGWEIVAFQTELEDELVPFEVETSPGRTFFRNEGESQYRGLEAALRVAMRDGVTARFAYTRVDARFRSGDDDGNRIPGRAPGLFEAVLEGDGPNSHWSLDVRWSGAVPVDDANTSEAPAHTIVGLRWGLKERELGSSLVSPWVAVRNILDEDHVSSVAVNAFGGRYFEPGPGRTFQAGLRVVLNPS